MHAIARRLTRFRTSTRIFRAAQNPLPVKGKDIGLSLSPFFAVTSHGAALISRKNSEIYRRDRIYCSTNMNIQPGLFYVLAAFSCTAGGQGLMKLAEKNANKMPAAVNVDAVALFSPPRRAAASSALESARSRCTAGR